MAMELHWWVQRQVAGRARPGVEMLVEPAVGRRQHAALVPRADDLLLALFPHDRVAFPGGNDNGASGTVAMRLLVRLGREDRHVRRDFRVGKLDVYAPAASAPPHIRVEFVPRFHVGEKVAVPVATPPQTLIALGHL